MSKSDNLKQSKMISDVGLRFRAVSQSATSSWSEDPNFKFGILDFKNIKILIEMRTNLRLHGIVIARNLNHLDRSIKNLRPTIYLLWKVLVINHDRLKEAFYAYYYRTSRTQDEFLSHKTTKVFLCIVLVNIREYKQIDVKFTHISFII